MQYLFLAATVVCEVIGTSLINTSEGFTRLVPALSGLVMYGMCFFFLSKALLQIDLEVAYATWCSAGIVLTSIVSAVVFGQKLSPVGVVSIVLIITGCVLLNLYGTVK